jgi:hypothetical protein
MFCPKIIPIKKSTTGVDFMKLYSDQKVFGRNFCPRFTDKILFKNYRPTLIWLQNFLDFWSHKMQYFCLPLFLSFCTFSPAKKWFKFNEELHKWEFPWKKSSKKRLRFWTNFCFTITNTISSKHDRLNIYLTVCNWQNPWLYWRKKNKYNKI